MEIILFGPGEREEIVELDAGPEELDIQSEEYVLESPVHVACRINRNGDLVRVRGEAHASLSVPCDRCLESFLYEVCGSFSFLVQRMPQGVPVPEDSETESEEDENLYFVEHDANTFDIGKYVHDAILLALPLKLLCREDCQGLCVLCGSNLNEGECGCRSADTDSRWQGLKKLSEK